MQTRERTRKRHRNTTTNTFSCVSEHIDTPKEPCTTVDTCCSPPSCCNPHCQGPSTATRHWPKMLTQKQMCEGTGNFANTHGGPTPGNTNRRCRIRGEKTHMKFALPTMCEHNTRPTWHMTPPQTNQLCFASRCVTSRYSTTPYLANRPCSSNDDVSERHDTNHDRCMTACRVFSQLA